MIIGDWSTEEKVLIIAEIGNNHEGDFNTAIKLINEAAKCGVGAVKFQTFDVNHYVSSVDRARFDRLCSFQLSKDDFIKLSDHAHKLGLLFLSTPFDIGSAKFLESLVDAYKISSGDITFYPLLDIVAKTKKPIIISTGASDLEQITNTYNYIAEYSNESSPISLALLHCISCYPAPPEQTNLQVIKLLSEKFDATIGYSDHTIGIDASLAAVAIGARIIEKHFTLSKNFSSFRDHQLSSDPLEMRDLVQKVDLVSSLCGKKEKIIQPCEKEITKTIRRSIVASKKLFTGSILSLSDISWIRPEGGLSPGDESKIIGKKLKSNKEFGEMIFENDVE